MSKQRNTRIESHGQFAAIGASGDHFDRIRKVVATATPLQRQTKKTVSAKAAKQSSKIKGGRGKKVA